jgi:hypothetical protein
MAIIFDGIPAVLRAAHGGSTALFNGLTAAAPPIAN